MNFFALIIIIFLSTFLLSITSYSFYVGFSSTSNELRDPFLDHEN